MSDSALILTKPLAHGILYIGEILHHFGLKETFSFIFGVAPPPPFIILLCGDARQKTWERQAKWCTTRGLSTPHVSIL